MSNTAPTDQELREAADSLRWMTKTEVRALLAAAGDRCCEALDAGDEDAARRWGLLEDMAMTRNAGAFA